MTNYMIKIFDGDELLDVCMFKADSLEEGIGDYRIQEQISKYEDHLCVKIIENIPTNDFKRYVESYKEFLKNDDIKVVTAHSKRRTHETYA